MKCKKQKINCSIGKQQQGFTLVEFMVASVLGLVVIAGAGALYSYTKRLNDIGMARVATLQDLRNASTMIGQDARSAGVFGCASLGRRHDPDATNATINRHGAGGNNNNIPGDVATPKNILIWPATLDEGSATDSAAGVRWVKQGDIPLTGTTWNGVKPTSDMLLFYYGEGSLAFKSSSVNSDGSGTVTFSTEESNPNEVVESLLQGKTDGGYVVAAGCNDLVFQKVDGTHSGDEFPVTVPPISQYTSSVGSGAGSTTSSIAGHADMILQRYKVVAYVVGDIAGEPPSLYRFEFGNNGDNWSAPQQLAKNVTGMEAEFLFVTDCKSGMKPASSPTGGASGTGSTTPSDELNSQTFDIKSTKAGDGAVFQTGSGEYYGPSSIHLTLTYNFPKIRGESVPTGKTDAAGNPVEEKFDISAVVRGGNVCASRKIIQL